MDNRLNVLYQFNEAYAPFAGASITSLLENNRHIDDIRIYVLEESVSEESKEKMTRLVNGYGRTIQFIETRSLVDKMRQLGIPEYRGSYSANFKLFFPELIQEPLNRILYIDSDTVVDGDLSPLLSFPMGDSPLAMAYDSLGKKHAKLLGLDEHTGYFNSGVILFDAVKWRERNCTERIVDHVKRIRAHYMSPDQDLLNVVFQGEISLLPASYNFQPIHIICQLKQFFRVFAPNTYYTASELTESAQKPVIFHFFRFLGQFPWHQGNIHPDRELFDKYLSMSPWSGYCRKPSTQNGFAFQAERVMYRVLPRCIFFPIFKLGFDAFMTRSWHDSNCGENNRQM